MQMVLMKDSLCICNLLYSHDLACEAKGNHEHEAKGKEVISLSLPLLLLSFVSEVWMDNLEFEKL